MGHSTPPTIPMGMTTPGLASGLSPWRRATLSALPSLTLTWRIHPSALMTPCRQVHVVSDMLCFCTWWNAVLQGMLDRNHLGFLSYSGLILGLKEWNWCVCADLCFKGGKNHKWGNESLLVRKNPPPPLSPLLSLLLFQYIVICRSFSCYLLAFKPKKNLFVKMWLLCNRQMFKRGLWGTLSGFTGAYWNKSSDFCFLK